jgi:hypothetical protein
MTSPSENEDSPLRNINQFRNYRGEPSWDEAEFSTNYRTRDYQYPNQPVVAVPPFPGWKAQAPPPPGRKPGQPEKEFLEQTIPEITTDPAQRAHWKGIKYLGGGGGGKVGLWEYTGPEDTAPSFRRVAVKELPVDYLGDDSLLQEGTRIERLREAAQSSHIITLQVPLQRVDAKSQGLPAEWQGQIRRLVFEYCDMGDLKGLIHRRITS